MYCLSRKRVDSTAKWLSERGLPALPYHAGMDQALRLRHQRRFLQEEHVIMVATIAFGMGIDKPGERFVAHLDLPKTLEGYYQETGRADRDGERADAWMSTASQTLSPSGNCSMPPTAMSSSREFSNKRCNPCSASVRQPDAEDRCSSTILVRSYPNPAAFATPAMRR